MPHPDKTYQCTGAVITPNGKFTPVAEVAVTPDVKSACPITRLAFMPLLNGGANISVRSFWESLTNNLPLLSKVWTGGPHGGRATSQHPDSIRAHRIQRG